MALSELTGLLGLAQHEGVDVRPTLLRVMTDLFAQRRIQSSDAARQYIHLTLELLESASLEARQTVAAKLARDPLAPVQIIERLARDELSVAEPVLRHSPRLTPDMMRAIAADRGPAYAAVIAARDEVGSAAEKSPNGNPVPKADAAASELCELFFAADSYERELILMNLDYSAPTPFQMSPIPQDIVARLENMALQCNPRGFARELEHAFGITNQVAGRIVDDSSGEPLVVVAKALRLPTDVLHRILLLLNPSVGHSVERVHALATLHDEITSEAARHLVAIWREANPRSETVRGHQPVHVHEERADPRPRPRVAPWGTFEPVTPRRAVER